MPSPFPGMDPYLEERATWPDVHASLISYIRESLQPQLRPKYLARITERIQLAGLSQGYVPDVLLVRPPQTSSQPTPTTTLVADKPQTFEALDEEVRVPYIEIIYRQTNEVVTVIEVLSPVNKVGHGREQYVDKQNDLIATSVHLVEIDLLSYGRNTVLARSVLIEQPKDWRYIVSVNRKPRRLGVEVYAAALKDRLPICSIPLRQPDPDAVLDLPTVFNRCYDVGGYDLLVDYTQDPPITLNDDEAAWVESLLVEKQFRPKSDQPASEA